MRHAESHRSERIGWLRAAVLGANDGIVSTASLILVSLPPAGPETEWRPPVSPDSLPAPCPWPRASTSRGGSSPLRPGRSRFS